MHNPVPSHQSPTRNLLAGLDVSRDTLTTSTWFIGAERTVQDSHASTSRDTSSSSYSTAQNAGEGSEPIWMDARGAEAGLDWLRADIARQMSRRPFSIKLKLKEGIISSTLSIPSRRPTIVAQGKVPALKEPTKAIPKELPGAKEEHQPLNANTSPKGKIPTLKAKKEILKLPSAAKAKGKHPLEHDPLLQHMPQRTPPKGRQQSCLALLYFSMFAVEARIPNQTIAGLAEMERTPAAYSFQRYQKLGGQYEAAGEIA